MQLLYILQYIICLLIKLSGIFPEHLFLSLSLFLKNKTPDNEIDALLR